MIGKRKIHASVLLKHPVNVKKSHIKPAHGKHIGDSVVFIQTESVKPAGIGEIKPFKFFMAENGGLGKTGRAAALKHAVILLSRRHKLIAFRRQKLS